MRREKASADPGSGSAERKHRGKPTPVSDPARCNDWKLADLVNDRQHQHHRCHASIDVAAGLPPLRHDHIRTVIHRTSCVGGGGNSMQDLCPAAMRGLGQFVTRLSPRKRRSP